MSKPWTIEPRGRQLEAFVGAYGIRTSQFETTRELIWFACRLFEIASEQVETIDQAASKIEAIGKKERGLRAKRNRDVLFPMEHFVSKPASASPDGRMTAAGLEKMMDASRPEMIDGEPFDVVGELDIDPAQLLRKVVSAVISADRPDILWEFPEVLAFFGSRIPQRADVAHLHNVDQRMFEAADKWPNRARPEDCA